MIEKQKEENSRKKWGIGLIITPIVLWLLVAMLNGFDFSRSWFGLELDLFFVICGLIMIIVGIAFLIRSI